VQHAKTFVKYPFNKIYVIILILYVMIMIILCSSII
jgi:hypothetical protein